MSRTAAEMAGRLDRYAKGIEARQKEAARAGARVVEREVNGRLRRATGGDGVLSGTTRTTGGRRQSQGRRMRVLTRPARSNPDGQFVSITGPAHLVENDVKRHVVVSRHAKGAGYTKVNARGRSVRGRSTRESRQASVLFGLGAGGGGRRAVLHWGDNYRRFTFAESKGRHPWRDGVRAARPKAVRAMRDVESRALLEAFR